uniref:Uncharacterized protein n=1 Tax=Triticum urartu TaxID=4572 RepID=A0A8R7QJT8_TRIUA
MLLPPSHNVGVLFFNKKVAMDKIFQNRLKPEDKVPVTWSLQNAARCKATSSLWERKERQKEGEGCYIRLNKNMWEHFKNLCANMDPHSRPRSVQLR